MKTGFCHFLEFGTSDGLGIVYYDSTNCFPALADHEDHLALSKYAISSSSEVPKSRKWQKPVFMNN